MANENMGYLTVTIHHEGCFTCNPVSYEMGESNNITDIDFASLDFNALTAYMKRYWHCFPSGYMEFEVRKHDEAFRVFLNSKKCSCKSLDLSGVPCVHAVATYSHLNKNPDDGVSIWYSKSMWLNANSHTIHSMSGSSMWLRTGNPHPLPPIQRNMPGRPTKKRKKHLSEKEGTTRVSKAGKKQTCRKCGEKGHNKSTCRSMRSSNTGQTQDAQINQEVEGGEGVMQQPQRKKRPVKLPLRKAPRFEKDGAATKK